MYIPSSTYRVQLHKEFTLRNLRDILPYLEKLGISTVYASPITTALKGSQHGYDNLDPLEINPEIGTMEEWEEIRDWLKVRNMGWLQDIVPNHMAYSVTNRWIFDLLEKGKSSKYFTFFDILPQMVPAGEEKIMLPFLGKPLNECLQDGEIELVFNASGFFLKYFSDAFPVAIDSYQWICTVLPAFHASLLAWSKKIGSYIRVPLSEWLYFKQKIMEEVWNNSHLRTQIQQSVDHINRQPDLLRELISFQHYELAWWKVSQTKMNYRRFFTVNALICLRMEDPHVFHTWHAYLLSLYEHGFIQGFRLDHIDGLFNPGEYVQRLRAETGEDAYIVSEKILQENEETIGTWPVQGTSGYDFLSFVNQLVTDHAGKKKLTAYYRNKISPEPYPQMVFEKKYRFLKQELNGEVKNLLRWLRPWREINNIRIQEAEMTEALAVSMAAFPVYRVYAERLPLTKTDHDSIAKAVQFAMEHFPQYASSLQCLRELFETPADGPGAAEALYFIRRWAQYTGPLAAKGVEDTVFYNYNVLIGHNEVGDSPDHRPVTAAYFHELMERRFQSANLSMNASSTHDTKRGEDNRLRINLISLYADEWMTLFEKIKKINAPLVKTEQNRRWPSLNDEYMICQALVGAVPANLYITDHFLERFKNFLRKSQREAKAETTWAEPNEAYEKHSYEFSTAMLSNAAVQKLLFPFLKKIIHAASIFTLTQTLIKLTAPGIPDIYQGADLWDLSLVDPDNRLPVDFSRRKKLMDQITALEDTVGDALDFVHTHAADGAEKLLLIRRTLLYRKQHPDLFSLGSYQPVISDDHLIAYARKWQEHQLLVLAPLPGEKSRITPIHGFAGRWKNLLTGQIVDITEGFSADTLFEHFPVALLALQND